MRRWPLCWLGDGLSWLNNTTGLYLETVVSYLFPLITLPYLVRVLGPGPYGDLAFAQSLTAYFLMVVDYGLVVFGTREAAKVAGDGVLLGKLVTNVVVGRLILAAALFPLSWSIAHLATSDRTAQGVIMVLYLSVVAGAFGLNWLYLAQQRMASLALVNLLVNLAVIAGIFAVVSGPHDLLKLAWILGLGPVVGNALGLTIGWRTFKLRLQRPSIAEVRQLGVQGLPIFCSQTAVALYTTLNPFLVGLWSSREAVGLYAAAEKLIRALLRLVTPLWTALFPTMVQTAARSPEKLLVNARKLLLLLWVVCGAAVLVVLAAAPFLVSFLFGPTFAGAVGPLRVLSLLLVLVATSSVLTLQILVPLGHDRLFTAVTLLGGLGNLALAALLVPRGHALGMAWAVVLTEVVVIAASLVALNRVLQRHDPSPRECSDAGS
ncbi:MAG: oligosaccharide flippase family protein [Thermoanaerobaculum sp.]|nr:oligosaccharide flippase family protein [Thermoanaerobaculum sp.]